MTDKQGIETGLEGTNYKETLDKLVLLSPERGRQRSSQIQFIIIVMYNEQKESTTSAINSTKVRKIKNKGIKFMESHSKSNS